MLGTYPELDSHDGSDAVRLCVDLVLFPRVYPHLYEWFLQKVISSLVILPLSLFFYFFVFLF